MKRSSIDALGSESYPDELGAVRSPRDGQTVQGMVSLKDIAKELDLSIGLVSKVLSGRMGTTGVSAEKREKIIATARARDFTPNRNALALRSGHVGTIGLFLHGWGQDGSEISVRFLRGFAESLALSSYHLWLTFFADDRDFHRQLKIGDLRRQADAVVIAGARHSSLIPDLEEIDRTVLPVIMSVEDAPPSSLTNIAIDTYQQGRMPTEDLIARGCRRIALVCSVETRRQGYEDAMKDANLSTANLIVEAESFRREAGVKAVRHLLETKVPFDGVVCHSDHQAMGVLQELHAWNIRVPDQVRVIGTDDGPLCADALVPLSSVTTEPRTLGMETVAAVLKRLSGKKIPSRQIQPKLIQRESSR